MQFNNTLQFAQQLDEQDPLTTFRQQFIIPSHNSKDQTYFLGNSLGLQPEQTKTYINKILNQWAENGVESFFNGDDNWLSYHQTLTSTLAEIVGCLPQEVTVMNQLTVNLHLMMVSFYQPIGKRNKIICEAKAFPSDQYMLETYVRHIGLNPAEVIIEIAPEPGTAYVQSANICNTIEEHKDEVALVFFGGINYYSGQLLNIQQITTAAHAAGAVAGFDLAHAAGNVALQLHNWNVDFACWCNYKYLNAGPGAVGAAYIHERYHQQKNINRLAGWWGYQPETRFKMEPGFMPAPSAEGWQLSTPSLLLYASLKASLDVFEKAGWQNILQKNALLQAYLYFLLNDSNPGNSFTLLTPNKPLERGCQLSLLMHNNGKQVFESLAKLGFMVDWREPDVIRLAPVALYNLYTEVWNFVTAFRQLM